MKRLIEANPYEEGHVHFTIGTTSATGTAFGFEARYNDPNTAWDATIGFGEGELELYDLLASSLPGVKVHAEVGGVTFDLTPRESDWPTLVEFARACGN